MSFDKPVVDPKCENGKAMSLVNRIGSVFFIQRISIEKNIKSKRAFLKGFNSKRLLLKTSPIVFLREAFKIEYFF